MANFTVTLEQEEDGSWGAYSVSPSVVAGQGDTQDPAIEDWNKPWDSGWSTSRIRGQPFDGSVSDVEHIII
jgi:hypothetical protein